MLLLLPTSIMATSSNHVLDLDADTAQSGPRWLVEPPNAAEHSNSTGLRLSCAASGWPRPRVEWWVGAGAGEGNADIDWVKVDVGEAVAGLRRVFDNGTIVFPPFR